MIVIPMAGMSSRFFKAGYTQPKYMLPAHGKTLFSHAVESFSKYFKTEHFLFIIRDEYNTNEFVLEQAELLGITRYDIVKLDRKTRGQAETVALGVEELINNEMVSYEESLTIFNIDTFRPGFSYPDLGNFGAGYLEVFRGEGSNWSFAQPMSDTTTLVKRTAEKKPISDLCCTGLYHFRSLKLYFDAYYDYLKKPKKEWEKGELYVAPLYNYLINNNHKIHYNLILREHVVFCGIPQEYIDFLEIET